MSGNICIQYLVYIILRKVKHNKLTCCCGSEAGDSDWRPTPGSSSDVWHSLSENNTQGDFHTDLNQWLSS